MARNTRRQPGTEIKRERISEVRRYMVWDCSSCGLTGLNANKCRQCPTCGNSKDASDNEERSATKVDRNYKFYGADITCEYCGTDNEKRFSCRQCGAALNKKYADMVKNFTVGTAKLPTRTVQIDDQGYVPGATETPWHDGSHEPVILEEPATRPSARTAKKETSAPESPPWPIPPREDSPLGTTANRSWFSPRLLIGAVLAIMLLAGVYVYNQLYSFSQTTVTIESVSWSYSLPREDYAARSRSNETESYFWRPPADAFDVRNSPTIIRYEPIYEDVWVSQECTTTETYSYDDVDGTWVTATDHVTYDCSGYERQQVGTEPIYGTRWTWKVMEWETTYPLTASGDSYVVEFPEFEPTPTLRQAGQPTTTFTITFTYEDGDGDQTEDGRTYPRLVWEQTSIGDQYNAVIDGFDNLRAVEGLDPDYNELLE